MGVGRFICVALPFILSAVSLVALLIACLGGVSNKDLYMFRVDMREMEISRTDIQGLVEGALNSKVDELTESANGAKDNITESVDNIVENVSNKVDEIANDVSDLPFIPRSIQERDSDNVTAKMLGLDYVYDIALWGFCQTNTEGNRTCTDPKFDWATEHLNTSFIEAVGELSGGRIELPDEVSNALDVFKKVSKWTQVAYIISFIALALSVFCGIFANCTRVMSCVTFLVATVAEIAVVGAASLSTVMSTTVVGVAESSAKMYGVRGSFNTTFLALVWISAAAAIGAAFFWLFTICCCAPNHSSRDRKSRKRDSDSEKLLGTKSGSYQPLGSPAHQGFYNSQTTSQYGAPRLPAEGRDMAYEPYSHRG